MKEREKDGEIKIYLFTNKGSEFTPSFLYEKTLLCHTHISSEYISAELEHKKQQLNSN